MKTILSDSVWDEMRLDSLSNNNYNFNLSILFSFWFDFQKKIKDYKNSSIMKNIDKYPIKPELWIDSGVYSARKLNIKIPVEELIKFCQTWKHLIKWVFTMDEGTAEEQFQNSIKLKQNNIPVIPIFHLAFMGLDYIDKFIDQGFDYLAIGGISAFKSGGKLGFRKYQDEFWNYIDKKNYFPIKVHLLGSEDFSYLSRYPYYSSDASTIVKTYIFGTVSIFNKKKITFDMVHPKNEPLAVLKKYPDLELFIEAHYLKNGGKNVHAREERIRQVIQERFKYQKLLTDLWTERGVIWKD